MRLSFVALGIAACLGVCQADLLVSNFGNDSVARFDNSGAFLSSITHPLLSGPRGIRVGPDQLIYAVSTGTDSVLRFDQAGTFIDTFIAAGLDNPTDLIFDANGDILVGDTGLNGVFKFNGATGACIGQFDIPNIIQQPLALAFGNNSVYVTNISGRVNRFDQNTGVQINTFSGINTFGVTVGPDNLVYLSDSAGVGAFLQSLNPNLTNPTDIVPPPGFGHGIEFGPDGFLYLARRFNDEVRRYDVNTGTLVDVFISTNLDQPQYLAFVAAVPEPGTYALAAAALLMLGLGKKLKR